MRNIRSALAALVLTTVAGFACGNYEEVPSVRLLAQQAVSADATQAAAAIRQLRELGPKGLEVLFDVHSAALANVGPIDAHLRRALEGVAAQKDAHASGLFWYTDLEQATAAARKDGRPILSLRLLGWLDEELSCANSRFFRTALYPNKEINQYLREHFVLHWESVRPAPKITVDFGDGRRLERTITGNSIHYVLSPEGRPVDAVPGLYGPTAFLEQLQNAARAAREFQAAAAHEREKVLRNYHERRLGALAAQWKSDLKAAGLESVSYRGDVPSEAWRRLAQLHFGEARLDKNSRDLLRAKNPRAADAGRLAGSKRMVEDPLLQAMGEFERSMAEDTVRNEYVFHSQIHEWFISGTKETREIRRLNERVYADLFLTPSSDPWLGLKPANALSALEGDGVKVARVQP